MQQGKDRIEFVIRFVNTDLDHLRPGDWLNLRDDFTAFLGMKEGAGFVWMGPIHGTPIDPPLPEDFTEGDFKTLQAELTTILTSFVSLKTGGSEGITPRSLKLNASLIPLEMLGPRVEGRAFLSLTGATRDIFLMMVFMLFAFESTARIGACAECERIMLRTKKREYCSSRCQTRAYMRRYRQQETVKQQENEQAHARYAKRANERSGGKAQRRPRKGGKTR